MTTFLKKKEDKRMIMYPVDNKANNTYTQFSTGFSNKLDELDEIKKELKILEKVQKKKKWHRRTK